MSWSQDVEREVVFLYHFSWEEIEISNNNTIYLNEYSFVSVI